jgi:hypothetical protein
VTPTMQKEQNVSFEVEIHFENAINGLGKQTADTTQSLRNKNKLQFLHFCDTEFLKCV